MAKERHKAVPASYLVLIEANKVLLLRRFNTGYEDGNYSMPAGHVDKGETFTECIVREANEEAGIILKTEDVKMACIMYRKAVAGEESDRIDAFFVAKKWDGEIINKEPNKCNDLSWFDLNNIPENTIPYIKHAIKCINKNIFYSEFGWD